MSLILIRRDEDFERGHRSGVDTERRTQALPLHEQGREALYQGKYVALELSPPPMESSRRCKQTTLNTKAAEIIENGGGDRNHFCSSGGNAKGSGYPAPTRPRDPTTISCVTGRLRQESTKVTRRHQCQQI